MTIAVDRDVKPQKKISIQRVAAFMIPFKLI